MPVLKLHRNMLIPAQLKQQHILSFKLFTSACERWHNAFCAWLCLVQKCMLQLLRGDVLSAAVC
jgi:hypothetical protein